MPSLHLNGQKGGGGRSLNYHNPPLAFFLLFSPLNNENTEIESFPLCFGSNEKAAFCAATPPHTHTHRVALLRYYISILFSLFFPFSHVYFVMSGT